MHVGLPGCHAACLLADSTPNATHKEHTRRGTTGKRLASIAYADPLHRTWFEVAQTSVCCIGRVAAGLAGRSHVCNWAPSPHPGDQTLTRDHQHPNPPTGKWDRANRTHTRSQSQRNACLPRRAGRIDDLVGPAMLRRGPLGSISDVSDPTSRSPKYISTPPAAALRPCLSFAISHMVAWSTVAAAASPPTPPPVPSSAPPIHTPAHPSPNSPKTTHILYLYTHPILPQPTACRFWTSRPGASTLLCRMQETCNAPASRDLVVAPQGERPLPVLASLSD